MELGLTLGLGYILLLVAYLIFFIYTLIKQAKATQWVWFVFTLIFGTIPMILWWIFGRK